MSGDGSIYKRTRTTPTGRVYVRWVAQVSFGPRGARQYARRVCRTSAAARDALADLMGTRDVSRQPLGEYLRTWLDETAGPTLAPSTVNGYNAVIASLEPIAGILLCDLTAEDIEGCLNRMTQRRYQQKKPATAAAPKTKRNALAMLRRALAVAEERGHLTRNVARMVATPRVPRKSRDAMTPGAAKAVRAAVAGERYAAAVDLAMCGLRISEVLGLAWADVDIRDREAGTALIRFQLIGSGEHAQRAPLKTIASESYLPLPPFVVDSLAEHRQQQLAERIAAGQPTTEGLVFVTPDGWSVNRGWLLRWFQGRLEAAKLPKLRMHDLRHGVASLLADAGVHPSITAAYMRHANTRTSLDVYTHTTKAQERTAADVLQRALVGA